MKVSRLKLLHKETFHDFYMLLGIIGQWSLIGGNGGVGIWKQWVKLGIGGGMFRRRTTWNTKE
jgi:hypothetical protein